MAGATIGVAILGTVGIRGASRINWPQCVHPKCPDCSWCRLTCRLAWQRGQLIRKLLIGDPFHLEPQRETAGDSFVKSTAQPGEIKSRKDRNGSFLQPPPGKVRLAKVRSLGRMPPICLPGGLPASPALQPSKPTRSRARTGRHIGWKNRRSPRRIFRSFPDSPRFWPVPPTPVFIRLFTLSFPELRWARQVPSS
jgi:hypothetical protein